MDAKGKPPLNRENHNGFRPNCLRCFSKTTRAKPNPRPSVQRNTRSSREVICWGGELGRLSGGSKMVVPGADNRCGLARRFFKTAPLRDWPPLRLGSPLAATHRPCSGEDGILSCCTIFPLRQNRFTLRITRTRPCVSHVGSRLHQLIEDELIWIGSDAEFAAKRTVQGEDHENEQPDKDGQQDDLDPLQSRILDLKKKG